MNTNKLQELQDVLDRMVSSYFVSGVSCMVIKDGQEVCYFESGLRDVENNLPLTRDTIFRMYSMTKPVTAVAIMQLMEKNIIRADQPVSDFIPSFKEQQVLCNDGTLKKCDRTVLIKDLLSMTSGIPYPGISNVAERRAEELINEAISKLDSDDSMTTLEIAERAGRNPLSFTPGTIWQYGFSADILGAVIEVATGLPLSLYLKENIFNPLEMNDTAFYVPAEKQSRFSKVYETVCEDNIPVGIKYFTFPNLAISNTMKKAPTFESGGAGLASTIDDYSHFVKMLLNNGVYNGKEILGKEAMKYMTGQRLTSQQQEGFNWGQLSGFTYSNLLRVMVDPSIAVSLGEKGEYGWDGWLGTYMSVDPVNNLGILIMHQKRDSGTTEYTGIIRNIVYSAI